MFQSIENHYFDRNYFFLTSEVVKFKRQISKKNNLLQQQS
jgi:hypothetical protein